jgi:Polyketide cyclase / dehydrase and lipid transport
MKWFLLVAAVLVILVLALLIFGLLQPAKHSATVSLHLKQKPETVFAALDPLQERPDPSLSLAGVERIADRNGNPAARYTVKWGRLQMTLTQLERTPPSRLVIAMARQDGGTLGTWTYALTDEKDGCRVILTEAGELKNPFFRALMRLHGPDAHIAQNLRDLAKRFGESAPVERGAVSKN